MMLCLSVQYTISQTTNLKFKHQLNLTKKLALFHILKTSLNNFLIIITDNRLIAITIIKSAFSIELSRICIDAVKPRVS